VGQQKQLAEKLQFIAGVRIHCYKTDQVVLQHFYSILELSHVGAAFKRA